MQIESFGLMSRSLRPHDSSASRAPRKRLGAIPREYRDTAASIVVSFGAQLALVVSGVVVARMLGVGDRGRLALLLLIGLLVTQLGSLGMPLAVTYWTAREPRTARRLVMSLGLFVWRQVPVLILIQALILLVALGGTHSYERTAAVISLLGTPAIVGWLYGLGILQGQRRFVAWNICRLLFPLGYAIVVSGLYVGNVDSLPIVVAAWTTVTWLSAGSTLWAAARGLRLRNGAEGGRAPGQGTMLRFGLKALLGSVSPLQTLNLDQAVVGLFISPIALGIYVVAVSFTNLPFFIAASIGAVAYPNIAARSDRRYVRRAIAASAFAVLVLAGTIVVMLEVALPWLVPRLFGAAFEPSVGVARILLIYGLLVALRRVLGDCARGAGRPGLSTLDEMAALICLIPTMLLLVPDGVKGVAVAMVISASVGLAVVVVGLIAASGPPDSGWRRLLNRSGRTGDASPPLVVPAPPVTASQPIEP